MQVAKNYPDSDPAAGKPQSAHRFGGSIAIGSGPSIRQQVYTRIRDAILDVRLAPGSVISENELASQLGVSRTPIRETLQRLAGEDLIRVVPQVGTFVAKMELARIREALFVRETVECAAIARIPRNLAAVELQRLEAIVSGHRAAVRDNDLQATLANDEAFHRRLLELAGLPGAWRYVMEAREMHRRVRVLAQPEFGAGRKSVVQHAAVVQELVAGKPAKAAAVLRDHIRMNLRFAEEIAQRYPQYFVAIAPAWPHPGT